MSKGWKRVLTDVGQVLSLFWISLMLFYFGFITGTISGSGLFGVAPSNDEKMGTNLGFLIVVVLIFATILTWRKRFLIRFAASAIGLIAFHAIVFGIYG